MTSTDQLHKINAFSSNPEIRKIARIQGIREFLEKAPKRDEAYAVDGLINGRFFPHVLEEGDLHKFCQFAWGKLRDSDYEWWLHRHALLAINDHAFNEAKILMGYNKAPVEFEVDQFQIFTPEILEFLKSESDANHLELKPFLNMNWDNRAGHEGFLLLHQIVGADRLKRHILENKKYDNQGEDFSALGVMAKLGLLNEFLDRETINILIARGFMNFLGESPSKDAIKDLVYGFESGRLFEALATESKFGDASKVTEAMKVILPYLTTANSQR
ncbi:hypothetical protein [Pseudomonas amygdali]|nr:hypothetical protein [Pseudomonas amygdali]